MTKQLYEMTVDELASSGRVGADMALMGRQTVAQIDSSNAQKASARYMLWSVIMITATSAVNAAFAFLSWYVPH